jgi:addiction module HigA family antidote
MNQPFTIEEVAKGLKMTHKALSVIINGKQSITPEMTLKLAKGFNTTPEFLMHAQENYELAQARKKVNVKEVRVFWKHRSAV